MKMLFSLLLFGIYHYSSAQSISEKLIAAFGQFENDSQLKHAISSLYVINSRTGKVVFDKNSQVGLADASTQKIITSVTAFDLLGKDYRYKTRFALNKNRDLCIVPSGDPTLGSWRWDSTRESDVLKRVVGAIQKAKIKTVNRILVDNTGFEAEAIPDGWIWQDIGNYYGAGAARLNWRENQFDLLLRSGKTVGDAVAIVNTIPVLANYELRSFATSASKGSGDNSYIYFSNNSAVGTIRGTIPANESRFKISGTIPDPSRQFIRILSDSMNKAGVPVTMDIYKYNTELKIKDGDLNQVHVEYSPSLDSIIYWFLKKSINLYGEALVKTMAYQKTGFGSTDSGTAVVKNFWKQKGLDPEEINISDGSGLSPLNRVTTHAQVEVLKYAKQQPWFSSFYYALPEYNDMKMKSGTISDVKGFTGYHTSKDGNEYIFSFLVNNYTGSASALVQKMYRVLNVLK